MRSVYVKEGPVVFLKQVLLMEIAAGVTLFAASFLGNYEMIYRGANLDKYLRYDTFIMVAFSLFQLTYLVSLFLKWYFSYFEIKNAEIIHKSGVLFHSQKSYSVKNIVSIGISQSPIDRIIGHATIVLDNRDGSSIRLRNVPNYQEYLLTLKRLINTDKRNDINDLQLIIERGERDDTEFKESLRVDVRTGLVNKDLERSVLKSIVGFMNADGGILMIGIKDGGEVVGIEADLKSLPKKNNDGFENHLHALIRESIGQNESKQVQISFLQHKERYVCMLRIEPMHRPAYLKNNDKDEFFVRVGNTTRPFRMSEAEEYIRSRFG